MMQWRRRMALPGQCIFLMQEDPLTTASVVQFFRLRILCLCALDLQALRRSGLPFPGALLRNLDITIRSSGLCLSDPLCCAGPPRLAGGRSFCCAIHAVDYGTICGML